MIGGGDPLDVDAPLFFVSPTQINFQIPTELLGDVQRSELLRMPFGVVPLIIGFQGTRRGEVLFLGPATPALFTLDQNGSGSVAALNEDGSLVSADGCLAGARPAEPGSVVQLFGTGQGALTPPLASGAPAPLEDPLSEPPTLLSETPTLPEVTLGGVPVTVEFSGAAPNFVGAWQINIRIPEDPPSGPAVPIIVTIEGVSSPPFTTLAVNTDVQPCQP